MVPSVSPSRAATDTANQADAPLPSSTVHFAPLLRLELLERARRSARVGRTTRKRAHATTPANERMPRHPQATPTVWSVAPKTKPQGVEGFGAAGATGFGAAGVGAAGFGADGAAGFGAGGAAGATGLGGWGATGLAAGGAGGLGADGVVAAGGGFGAAGVGAAGGGFGGAAGAACGRAVGTATARGCGGSGIGRAGTAVGAAARSTVVGG